MSIINELFQILEKKDFLDENKKDPKAKVRNKPSPIFDAKSKDVNDDKDHFPIDTVARARNALARVEQFDKNPPWHNGTLTSLKKKVKLAVHKAYPSIDKK